MGEPTIPVPIGDIDLENRAKDLGIKYFIPSVYSLNVGIKGPLVPVSAIRRVQQRGVNMHGWGNFGNGGTDPENYCVPDPTTLIQLPWKPEFGWLAW